MQKTKNYGLTKPEVGEFYNVLEVNANMDIIDEKLKEVEELADGQTVQDILSGTTPAGDSKKLNGLGAEEFVKGTSDFFTSGETVLSWALNPKGVNGKIAVNYVAMPSDGIGVEAFYRLEHSPNGIIKVIAETIDGTGTRYKRIGVNNAWYTNWTDTRDGGNADTVDGYHASEWFMHSETETARFKSLTEIPNGKWKFFEGQNMFTDYPASLTARGLIYGIVNIDTNATNTNYKTGTIIATNAMATAVDSVHFFWNRDIRQLSFVEHLTLTGGKLLGDLSIAHTGDNTALTSLIQWYGTTFLRNKVDDANYFDIIIDKNGNYRVQGYKNNVSYEHDILHTGNIGQHAIARNGGSAVDSINVMSVNHTNDTSHTRLICNNSGVSYLVNALPNYSVVRQISIEPKNITDNPNDALKYQYTEDGSAWYNVAIHHDLNSAKVLVSNTPLTAEGSVRVW